MLFHLLLDVTTGKWIKTSPTLADAKLVCLMDPDKVHATVHAPSLVSAIAFAEAKHASDPDAKHRVWMTL